MPIVETAHLELRHFSLDDLDQFASLLADPDVVRHVGNGLPIPRDEAEIALQSIIRHWTEHGFGRWLAIERESQAFAGFGGLRSLMGTPEVVYHFWKSFWGKGFATELARASFKFGFEEHNFERIIAVAKPENTASIRVMEKAGMCFDARTSYYDIEVIQYQILREQFQKHSDHYRLH